MSGECAKIVQGVRNRGIECEPIAIAIVVTVSSVSADVDVVQWVDGGVLMLDLDVANLAVHTVVLDIDGLGYVCGHRAAIVHRGRTRRDGSS